MFNLLLKQYQVDEYCHEFYKYHKENSNTSRQVDFGSQLSFIHKLVSGKHEDEVSVISRFEDLSVKIVDDYSLYSLVLGVNIFFDICNQIVGMSELKNGNHFNKILNNFFEDG